MERWRDKVAAVSGASSGIGLAIARDLLTANIKVVALARRYEKLVKFKESLSIEQQVNYFPRKCDVTDEKQVKKTFSWMEEHLSGVDILINNAGVDRNIELVSQNNTQDLKDIVDTNILGVAYCTREAFHSMKKRNLENGHIVLINSVAGHIVPNLGIKMPSFHMYSPTKFAVTAMNEVYRQEFLKHGSKIKISSISPGATDTDIFPKEFSEIIRQFPMLKPEDVSNAVMFAIGTPPHVQIHELIIKPVGEPI